MRLNRTRICAWILSLAMVAASATGAGVPSYTAQAAGGDIKTYSFGSGGAVTKASVYDPAIGFGFTDVSYPNESAGWVNNVYRPREKAEATGASNVTNGTDYLTIASKVWTETGVPLGTDKSTQGTFRYDDTSAFNVDLSPVDYNVSVTLANPTDKPIDVQLIAEDLVKAIVTVPAGSASTPVPSFLISLIDNQLNLKFEAVSTATALDEAVPQNVYVKSVAIEEKETESKGVKPTVYIASDSTVQTYDANFYPQTGWGQVLYKYFAGADEMVESSTAADYGQSRKYDMPSCTIENRAIGGRSSKSFIDEGKLDSILNSIRPGDYMLVQWGHNDATYARPNRYVSSADFSKYIQKYIDGCRERSATCILVTPVPRYVFQNGKCQISFPEYRQVMLDLAAAQKIPVLDLGKAGADFLTGFGETESRSVFMQLDPGEYPNYPNGQSDATHYQEFGAAKMAKILAQLIKKNDQLQSLAALVPEITVPVKVPDQPKSLTAVTVGSSSVKIQWGAVTGADLYNIYRAESTAGQTADPADFKKCGTSVTAQYTDKNCQGGYTYAYKVSAVNDKGESEKSETLSATTKDSLYKYDFTGSGTNKKDAVGPTMQGWNQVKDNQMYSQKDGYGFLTAPLDGRTRSIEGVNDMECDFCLSDHDYEFAVDLPNGTYSVKTYAGDPIGSSIKTTVTAEGKALYTVVSPKKGVGSKEAEATVTDGQLNLVISGNRYLNGIEITPLSVAPSGLDCYELDLTKSTQEAYFSLRFNPSPDAVSYRIYHKLSTDAKYTLLDSFDTDHFDDLHSYHEKKGGIYNYYAVGVLADGTESGSSNVISVNMMDSDATPPLAPTGLVCDSAKNGEIKIHWNASAGATGYVVYRSAKPGTDF